MARKRAARHTATGTSGGSAAGTARPARGPALGPRGQPSGQPGGQPSGQPSGQPRPKSGRAIPRIGLARGLSHPSSPAGPRAGPRAGRRPPPLCEVGVWVGVGVGAGGVWRRVVVCAARRPVRVVHGLSVLFSYLVLSYLIFPSPHDLLLFRVSSAHDLHPRLFFCVHKICAPLKKAQLSSVRRAFPVRCPRGATLYRPSDVSLRELVM